MFKRQGYVGISEACTLGYLTSSSCMGVCNCLDSIICAFPSSLVFLGVKSVA